jgi:EAL domain-containing protein (putative c-di-GMP-specific phosphodiesterase class I)
VGIPEGRVDVAIVDAILRMAEALDLKVVAEGVETIPQAQALADVGVDLMQGYLFQRPAPAHAVDMGQLVDPASPIRPQLGEAARPQ